MGIKKNLITSVSLLKTVPNAFLFLLIILVLGIILFFQRHIFFYRYEPEYYEGLYYHSQWNYPNSTRGISDGELYKFVGYRLAEGENHFNINYEMPPFGKYLYGLAEKYLGNPYWISIVLYLFSAGFLFLLGKEILKETSLSLLGVLFFLVTPFVSTQIGETMLDLPLMFFYLVHAFFFVKFLLKRQQKYLITSGLFLGLATGTKPGIYTPFVFLLESIIYFKQEKERKVVGFSGYLISVFAGYVLAFFCYFIKHPNPIPWLRLHQKQFSFYMDPLKLSGPRDYLLVWKNIFSNSYQGWWWTKEKTIGGASLILPVGTILLLPVIFLSFKKREISIFYLSCLTCVFLLIDHFVFFPRYLMPTIPFFILITVFFLKKHKQFLFLLSCLSFPFLFSSLSARNPVGDVEAVGRFFATRAYHELYRSTIPDERKNLSEKQFIDSLEYFLETLGTRDIKTELLELKNDSQSAKAKYKVVYETKYGILSHEPEISFLKVNNQWRQVWNWDLLWLGYDPSAKIITREGSLPLKRLQRSDGTILAERGKWQMVYMFPRVMFDWSKALKSLSEVIGENPEVIDLRLRKVVPDHFVRFAGYLDPALGQEGIDKANLISGVHLREVDYLVIKGKGNEEVSRIIRSIQKEKPELFCIKAEVVMQGKNEEEKVLPLQCSEEKDVKIII
ncbi:MAG: hypothetical protein BWY24_00784 [Microgenomates group bacterium ADurb.Bin219]|nr:MAG: hypothetical protein BWY24_00784 [Microgenomates group bacterium ADurb.Bin219]